MVNLYGQLYVIFTFMAKIWWEKRVSLVWKVSKNFALRDLKVCCKV